MYLPETVCEAETRKGENTPKRSKVTPQSLFFHFSNRLGFEGQHTLGVFFILLRPDFELQSSMGDLAFSS